MLLRTPGPLPGSSKRRPSDPASIKRDAAKTRTDADHKANLKSRIVNGSQLNFDYDGYGDGVDLSKLVGEETYSKTKTLDDFKERASVAMHCMLAIAASKNLDVTNDTGIEGLQLIAIKFAENVISKDRMEGQKELRKAPKAEKEDFYDTIKNRLKFLTTKFFTQMFVLMNTRAGHRSQATVPKEQLSEKITILLKDKVFQKGHTGAFGKNDHEAQEGARKKVAAMNWDQTDDIGHAVNESIAKLYGDKPEAADEDAFDVDIEDAFEDVDVDRMAYDLIRGVYDGVESHPAMPPQTTDPVGATPVRNQKPVAKHEDSAPKLRKVVRTPMERFRAEPLTQVGEVTPEQEQKIDEFNQLTDEIAEISEQIKTKQPENNRVVLGSVSGPITYILGEPDSEALDPLHTSGVCRVFGKEGRSQIYNVSVERVWFTDGSKKKGEKYFAVTDKDEHNSDAYLRRADKIMDYLASVKSDLQSYLDNLNKLGHTYYMSPEQPKGRSRQLTRSGSHNPARHVRFHLPDSPQQFGALGGVSIWSPGSSALLSPIHKGGNGHQAGPVVTQPQVVPPGSQGQGSVAASSGKPRQLGTRKALGDITGAANNGQGETYDVKKTVNKMIEEANKTLKELSDGLGNLQAVKNHVLDESSIIDSDSIMQVDGAPLFIDVDTDNNQVKLRKRYEPEVKDVEPLSKYLKRVIGKVGTKRSDLKQKIDDFNRFLDGITSVALSASQIKE